MVKESGDTYLELWLVNNLFLLESDLSVIFKRDTLRKDFFVLLMVVEMPK